MEILKRNLEKQERERIFSKRVALGCSLGAALGLFAGIYLDSSAHAWKALLFFSALLGLGSVLYQSHLPMRGGSPPIRKEKETKLLFLPWKESLSLKRKKRVCLLAARLSLLRGGADALVDSSGALPLRYPGPGPSPTRHGALDFLRPRLCPLDDSLGKAPQPPLNPKGDERHLCRFCALFYLPPPRADLSALALCRFFALRGVSRGEQSGLESLRPLLCGEGGELSLLGGQRAHGRDSGSSLSIFRRLPLLGNLSHFPFALGILGCLIGSYLMLRKPKGVRATA